MNTYSDSKGNRYTTKQIDKKSNVSAKLLLEFQFLEYGYNFCTHCFRNDDKPIDVSHTVSRKKAKEDGCVELIWDFDNMEILGRKCHKIKDKLT
tara:strand:+ start:1106 stop:1387 length:282 start_codon:yes stop_codon:yes gene_type:complete